jgi:hypothetical protein
VPSEFGLPFNDPDWISSARISTGIEKVNFSEREKVGFTKKSQAPRFK